MRLNKLREDATIVTYLSAYLSSDRRIVIMLKVTYYNKIIYAVERSDRFLDSYGLDGDDRSLETLKIKKFSITVALQTDHSSAPKK